jgi:hypothetical protein
MLPSVQARDNVIEIHDRVVYIVSTKWLSEYAVPFASADVCWRPENRIVAPSRRKSAAAENLAHPFTKPNVYGDMVRDVVFSTFKKLTSAAR